MNEIPKLKSILRLAKVMVRTGLSRSALYQKLDEKSPHFDPLFPKQIKLGANAVGWLESEVDNWIESRIQASRPTIHVEEKV
ncbi:MAG: AlpA family phage regulatory protein [Undibacterium umbellatum]|uniref:helix-turn-helix transcriptional regulator n=1 Tax=Undibacterium umbellatum TaxID=2762300 RepID=UPI003BB688E0